MLSIRSVCTPQTRRKPTASRSQLHKISCGCTAHYIPQFRLIANYNYSNYFGSYYYVHAMYILTLTTNSS